MSSFNYIGNRWAGGIYELCETVLRDEWGFEGFVETDYFGVYGYVNADQAIRNSTDLMLVNYQTATNNIQFRSTNAAQQAMRQSAHRIRYVVVNSRQYSELGIEMSGEANRWETILTVVNVVMAIVLVVIGILLIKNYLAKKKDS